MNCFNHRDKPAIGLCRSCGRALCENCLAEVGRSIACKDACEDRVRVLNQVMAVNPQIVRASRAQARIGGFILLFMGLCSLVIAVGGVLASATVVAACFGFLTVFCLSIAFMRLSRKYEYPALKDESSSNR